MLRRFLINNSYNRKQDNIPISPPQPTNMKQSFLTGPETILYYKVPNHLRQRNSARFSNSGKLKSS